MIVLQLSLRNGSSFFERGDFSQTEHAYSAAEKQRASAVALSIGALAPQEEFASFWMVDYGSSLSPSLSRCAA